MKKTWTLFGLFALLLVATTVVAQPAPTIEVSGRLDVSQSGAKGEVINAGLIIPLADTSGIAPTDRYELYNQINAVCGDYAAHGYPNYDACYLEESKKYFGTEKFIYKSLENAKIGFAYYNPIAHEYEPIEGCEGLPATNSEQRADPANPDDPWKSPFYYATCTVPESVYRGSKANIVVAYLDTGTVVEMDGEKYIITAEPKTVDVSDVQASVIDAIYKAIYDQVMAVKDANASLCIGVFLLIGMLLASMYFSGKSPMSLLDITSPKMPMPKGLTAGGQVVLPYGYGEMKRTLGNKLNKGLDYLGKATPFLANKYAGTSAQSEFQGKTKNMNADEKQVAGALYYGALSTGKKDDAKKILKQFSAHTKEEGTAVQSILNAMRAKGGREAIMAAHIQDWMVTRKTLETMDVLSGHPAPGVKSRWHSRMQSVLGKFTGANRYSTMSFVGGLYESQIRSGRWVARGAKQMIVQAPTLARGAARTTMELVGGPRAMEKLEAKGKVSPMAAWAAKQIQKPGVGAPLGQKVAIHEKMAAAYEKTKDEVKRDSMVYAIKQLYKALGVNVATMTEADLLQMCMKDINILQKLGYDKAASKIQNVEKELMAILSGKGTLDDKLMALVALAKANGAVIDSAMLKFNDRINEIDKVYGKDDGYLKYLMLRETLAEHEKTAMAAGANQAMAGDKFYTIVGRPSVNGSDIFTTMVLRTMIWDGENGYLKGGLKEALWRSVLEVRNRVTGLNPTSDMNALPEFMRNMAELKKIEASNKAMVLGIMTDAGRKELATRVNGAPESASMKQVVEMLYGKGRLPGELTKLKEDRLGRVAFWEDEKEAGPAREWFKLDMKRSWVGELKAAESYAIGQWVENRFSRGGVAPYKASIEAEINRMPGSARWSAEERTAVAKKMWVMDQLKQDCEQRFNSQFAHDAYGKFGERANFYTAILLGFYEKAMRDKGLLENHPEMFLMKNIDASNPAQLKKFREEIATKYRGEFMAELKKPVAFDDILNSQRAMVQLYEGEYAYYRKGMPLSVNDKVYGEVAIRDNKGQWRKFVAEDVVIQLPPNLQKLFYEAKEKGPSADWDVVMEGAKKWSKGDYDKGKMFAALVTQYGRNTSDYQRYWRDTALEVKPMREVMDIAPQSLRMLGVGTEDERVRRAMSAWRNLKTDIGSYFVKTTMMGAGPVFDASYDVVARSEYLKNTSFRLAMNYFTMTPEERRSMSAAEKSAYRETAIADFGFRHAQVWAIDRGVRASQSQGLLQVTEHFFHHGPGHLLGGVKEYVRGTMTGGEWASFMAFYGWPMGLASAVHKPFVNVFRQVQVSMHGGVSRWDQVPDSLKPFEYTEPRLLEAVRGAGTGILGTGKLSKYKLWESATENKHIAGKEIMDGLRQAPSDIFFRRTGVEAYARVGRVNPATSYLGYRHEYQFDEAMANYMWRNRDAAYSYDTEIQQQAMRSTVRRTVSAEALAMKFDQEMRHLGVSQMPVWGWFCAPLFAYHMPLPGFPTSLTMRDAAAKYSERRKYGTGASWDVKVAGVASELRDGLWRAATPWKAAAQVFCPRCGAGHMRGERCRCGASMYSGRTSKHAWGSLSAAA